MKRPPAVLAAVLAGSALLTGCGPDTPLDVDLRAVSISVPRLVTPAVEIVPEAPLPLPAPLAALPPLRPLPRPARPSTSPALPPPTAPVVTPEACPTAPTFAAPAKASTPLLEGPPAPGTSTFAATGDFTSPAGTGSLAGVVTTTVTSLPSSTTGNGQEVEAWEVQRTDPVVGTVVERYRLVHPSDALLANEPGIYLAGLQWDDAVRGQVRFEPAGAGLLVLPNPVVLSTTDTQYTGAATDPDTLTTLSLTRNVRALKRIDLCGQLVDAYTVEMTGTLFAPGTQYSLTWTQQLAGAYGGANVEESLGVTSADGATTWRRDLRGTALPAEVVA